jgi:hypothetical protein
MASSQQVEVDVVDGLATMLSCIDNSAIALLEAFGAGNLSRGPMQMANQRIVLFSRMRDRGYVLAGYDQDVHGRLWIDVGEGVALVILVNGFGGDASIDNPAKETAHG